MAKNITSDKIKEIEKQHGFKISQYWLNQLLSIENHEIGVVKASGKLIVGRSLEIIVNDFKTLHDELGITLPLIIGGGVQYDELPAYKKSKKINGIRITSNELLDQMLPVAKQNLDNVVAALNEVGVEAMAMPYDVLRVKPHGFETSHKIGMQVDTGFVGDVVYVDTAPIIGAIYDGKVPVLSHIGVDDSGQLHNTNAMHAAAAVVKYLQACKLILLGDCPILDRNGNTISEFKSEAEAHKLRKEGTLTRGALYNVSETYKLLKEMGPGCSVQMTTPKGLPAELLTDGDGTILRIPFIIQSYGKPEHIGESELISMINGAFASREKVLAPGYFGHDSIYKIYVDAEKTGGAVVKNIDGVAYMCKIFTHPDYRGNGLATQIMERIDSDYKKGFMWRTDSSYDNKDTIGFYTYFVDNFKDSDLRDGILFTNYQKIGDFVVFGVNMDYTIWDNLKNKVAGLPKTMVKK